MAWLWMHWEKTSFPIIPVEPVSINFIMGDVSEACFKTNSTEGESTYSNPSTPIIYI
jgi:hypothetical protein